MSPSSWAAEETLLLEFQSHLIGKIESQQEYRDLDQFIDSYYALLSRDNIERAQNHRLTLSELIPQYKIAYTAADSAELAELMDEISYEWERLSNLHRLNFSMEVSDLLDSAYDQAMENALSSP